MRAEAGPGRRRRQLSDEASSYVRGLIMSGELLPGSSVRPEVIGDALDISTTPAREALQALRVEGFLELMPRKGFIVAPLTGDDIRDLFQAQALLAGELAARAACTANDDDLRELEALHHELIAAARRGDHELLEEKNHAFHRRINLIADSRKIAWAMSLVTRYVPRAFYASIPGWPETTVEDHAALLQGISANDPRATRAAMFEHIVRSGEQLAQNFDQRLTRGELAG